MTPAEENKLISSEAKVFDAQCQQRVDVLIEQGLERRKALTIVSGYCVGVATSTMGHDFVQKIMFAIPR